MAKRKVRAITSLFLIFVLLQPFLILAVVNWIQDISKDELIKYDITAIYLVKTTAYNSTSGTWLPERVQDYIFDNDTLTVIVTTLNFTSDAAEVTKKGFYVNLNLTAIDITDVYKIVVEWAYIGPGNITEVAVTYDMDSYAVFGTGIYTLTTTTGDPAENGSLEYVLQSFEYYKLKDALGFRVSIKFYDPNYLPVTGDYIEVSIRFYKKALVVSRDTLIKIFVGIFVAINFILALAISPLWNPLKQAVKVAAKKKSQRKQKKSKKSKKGKKSK